MPGSFTALICAAREASVSKDNSEAAPHIALSAEGWLCA